MIENAEIQKSWPQTLWIKKKTIWQLLYFKYSQWSSLQSNETRNQLFWKPIFLFSQILSSSPVDVIIHGMYDSNFVSLLVFKIHTEFTSGSQCE